ncbi:MAG TPA: DsbA family protein, partial [Anaerolineales bacterium]
QDALDEAGLRQAAVSVGLDLERYEADMAAHAQMGRIQEDYEGGLESGVMGTPTLFVNGKGYAISWAAETLLPALESAAVKGDHQ